MNIIHRKTGLAMCLAALLALPAFAQNPPAGDFPPPRQAYKIQTPTYLADYFTEATPGVVSPDENGFIRRWLLLEPIDKPNRSNTVFTDSYLRQTFDTLYFKNQFSILPKDGDKVKVGKQKLAWHALDSKLYNVKLYRLAAGLKKQVYGVLFWAVTVIDCPEDMENVRFSAGSNSASMWWLNGEEVLLLSGDRRMVVDDGLSRRLTLKKGRNILRGAIINGPGMSDFCVRFMDENGMPVTNITISYQ
ncbi:MULTISPECIES: acetylxylan esterase [unclassified Parabacteroides]|uniref:acetylxylan esterase n=1 Tax=unclassified Parabacteroides TaxID=2649774 RepID=UPI00247326C6|nr:MULTISPECIES: acetylxylan esterase [unclassified Parabacteroides]